MSWGVYICEHFIDYVVKRIALPYCDRDDNDDEQTIVNEPNMHRHKYDLSEMMCAPIL